MKTKPERSDFNKLAKQARYIPVGRDMLADTETPVSAFLKLAGAACPACLLESVEGGEKWGRYSFIGLDPIAVWKCKGHHIELTRNGQREMFDSENVIESLRKFHASFQAVHPEGLPRLAAGMIGYLGYEIARHIEKLPEDTIDDLGMPDAAFFVPRIVVAFDNVRHLITVMVLADSEEEGAYDKALSEIENQAAALARPCPEEAPLESRGSLKVESNMSRQEYQKGVERARQYIHDGDAIQVVLSQRFRVDTRATPLMLYRALRLINPSPYMFFLRFKELALAGSSPELLVRLNEERLFLRPIAGTRRRGEDEKEDRVLAEELIADPKERAEHIMLVDLGRNDLGRVAEYGSVDVKELMRIERYSHVMHLVTDIEADLNPGMDGFDALKASFPAGTLTGAPKVRAMEIIEELEPTRRGPYGGCVGYMDFAGDMDMCIAIRMFLARENDVTVQAGAGIVADSVPEREHDECCRKAQAAIQAAELAEELFGKEA
jgi:anthranilate synthase component 1